MKKSMFVFLRVAGVACLKFRSVQNSARKIPLNRLLFGKKKDERIYKSTDKYQFVVFANTTKAIGPSITTKFVESYS